MKFELAARIKELPPYLFADIDRKKVELRKQGKDLIDLGIGDPDLPTPAHIVQALQAAAAEPRYHRYPSYEGMQSFREAAVGWYERRFGVKLDAGKECCALIGSKEGIAHFPVAFVNPGDVVLVPDPGYPVYATWTRFVGGEVHYMPLRRENGFLPDLKAIPADVAKRAKMMWINYPNNPTAALATREFYKEVVAFAQANNIIVASDVAYSEIFFEGEPPASFLEVPGAKEVGIEFQSLSKTYNMTGWRVGFAVGNEQLVGGLGKVKTNTDSGAFEAVQAAAVTALSSSQKCVEEARAIYKERREVLCGGLEAAGFEVLRPKATFYVLVRTPKGYTSVEFVDKLLDAGVVSTPATGFGAMGEGYIRLTLCADKARMKEAASRIQTVKVWVIDHVVLRTRDYERAKAFYRDVLVTLGYTQLAEFGADEAGRRTCGFGSHGKPSFWLAEGPAAAGEGEVHVAITAPDHAAVDAFYRAALAAGGRDNGAPGPRPHYHRHYYGAFVFDLDGHNLEAVVHKPVG